MAAHRYPRALDPDVLHRNLALFCTTLGTAAPAPHATTHEPLRVGTSGRVRWTADVRAVLGVFSKSVVTHHPLISDHLATMVHRSPRQTDTPAKPDTILRVRG